jgi:hypothetical protein
MQVYNILELIPRKYSFPNRFLTEMRTDAL